MPMILPMSVVAPCLAAAAGDALCVAGAGSAGSGRGVGGGDRHGHEGRADDAVAEPVAPPDLFDDRAVRLVGARHVGDRLVLARVERLARIGVDGAHALALEEEAELAID